MRRLIPRRIGARLFVVLTVALVCVELVFGYQTLQDEQRRLSETVESGADQVSRSLISATWQAMLADHRADAYEVMRTMGRSHGIECICLTDGGGTVTFTTGGTERERWCGTETAVRDLVEGAPGQGEAPTAERLRYIEADDGNLKLGLITPIFNEPSCQTAACHAHPRSDRLLGALDVVLDIGHVKEELARLGQSQLIGSLTRVAVLGACIFLFTRWFVQRPVRQLMEGAEAIREGDLDRPLIVESNTELGELGATFVSMQERLRAAHNELERFTRTLEDKVEDRGRELDSARRKLIQSDRLASLGQLAASVAHEINNPIGGVLNLSMLLRRILTEQGIPDGREEEFRRHLDQICEETARVGRIVTDLLAFSRRSRPQRTDADLNAIIRRTLNLVAHKLQLQGAKLELRLDQLLPAVSCDPAQMEQVVLNLVMNAAESMVHGGVVCVQTGLERDGAHAVLRVTDEGSGIPAHVLPRIFDPFFSTKEEGKGVGLGLAVVYGIVDAHGGTLDVVTHAGAGTTFTAHLPIRPEAGDAAKETGTSS